MAANGDERKSAVLQEEHPRRLLSSEPMLKLITSTRQQLNDRLRGTLGGPVLSRYMHMCVACYVAYSRCKVNQQANAPPPPAHLLWSKCLLQA